VERHQGGEEDRKRFHEERFEGNGLTLFLNGFK
jgi:hypothetical protein